MNQEAHSSKQQPPSEHSEHSEEYTRRQFLKSLKNLGFSLAIGLIIAKVFSIEPQKQSESVRAEPELEPRKTRVRVREGETLEKIAERWSVLGSNKELIKQANEIDSAGKIKADQILIIPFFLPPSRDFSEQIASYREECGLIALEVLQLSKHIFERVDFVSKPKPIKMESSVSIMKSSVAIEDPNWLDLAVLAKCGKHHVEAITAPEQEIEFHQSAQALAEGLEKYCLLQDKIQHKFEFGFDEQSQESLYLQADRLRKSLIEPTNYLLDKLHSWGLLIDKREEHYA